MRELAGCEQDFFKLKNLLLVHKVFDSCNELFVTHLLERGTSDISDMESHATAYFQAHSGAKLGKVTESYLGANASYSDRGRFDRKTFRDKHRSDSGSRKA